MANTHTKKTWNTHTKKLKMPCKAVTNGLNYLNILEVVLTAKVFLFKKIVILPKTHGSIVNVTANVSETCNQLSLKGTCEEAIVVKLKKKLFFKGHVYFEPVRPQRVRAALNFLQRVNPLYCDVLIKNGNNNQDFLLIGKNLPESDIDFEIKSDGELESTSNPSSARRHAANESLVVENDNLLELALGQDKDTRLILFDKKCKELAFPKIFFKGKFTYTFTREHYLTPTKYFNQRLLNFLQTFASNNE